MLPALLERLKELTDYRAVEERLARVTAPRGEFGVDPFGFDPSFMSYIAPLGHLLYQYWFRVRQTGAERLPPGRALLVANHSGQLPFDAIMIGAAVLKHSAPPRVMRAMVDRFVPTTPFVSYLFPRWGQITGTAENARLLLEREELLLVFPEGVRGLSKTFDQAYRLQEFGTGFMRIALATGTPIVPVAVVGAEEQAPSFYNFKALGRLLGFPAFPITPTNPWLPLIGLLPYPTRYYLEFGEPLRFEGDPHDEDEALADPVERVRQRLQEMIDGLLARRPGVFV